jgi:AbrB family looped-hinge helix DNA binding protein
MPAGQVTWILSNVEGPMLSERTTVTVSSSYRVVIPSRVRSYLGITPGQKVLVLLYDNRFEIIPVRPSRELRGFLKGIDTTIEREPVDPERNCLHHPSDV